MVLREIFERMDKARSSMEFMKTGFTSVDEGLDGGFLRKELVVLGAFTGIGKSYIAGQLMLNIAKQGYKCAYFSLEISNEMIVARMVGSIANIKPTRIQSGFLTPDEFEKRTRAKAIVQTLEDFAHFYDDVYELNQITKIIRENDYEFVIIDFIQNIMSGSTDEYTRLTKVALELQKLAKDVNCTILTLSQLSNTAAREGSSGKILEYKGSGAIATVCDLGFFLERIENGDTHIQTVKLSLRKNRRGISGMEFYLNFKIPGGELYEA